MGATVTSSDYCFPAKNYFYFLARIAQLKTADAKQICSSLKGELPSEEDENLIEDIISVRYLKTLENMQINCFNLKKIPYAISHIKHVYICILHLINVFRCLILNNKHMYAIYINICNLKLCIIYLLMRCHFFQLLLKDYTFVSFWLQEKTNATHCRALSVDMKNRITYYDMNCNVPNGIHIVCKVSIFI